MHMSPRAIIYRLLILPCTVFFSSLIAVAEAGPSDVLQAIVSGMREKGGELPALEYIDWNSAFTAFSTSERLALNIHTEQELREHYRKAWSDPALLIEPQIEAQLQSMSEGNRLILKREKAGIIQSSRERFEELNARYRRAVYRLGAEEINGDSATVVLETIVDGVSLEQKLPFIHKSNGWYLAGVFQFLGSDPTSLQPDRLNGSITP